MQYTLSQSCFIQLSQVTRRRQAVSMRIHSMMSNASVRPRTLSKVLSSINCCQVQFNLQHILSCLLYLKSELFNCKSKRVIWSFGAHHSYLEWQWWWFPPCIMHPLNSAFLKPFFAELKYTHSPSNNPDLFRDSVAVMLIFCRSLPKGCKAGEATQGWFNIYFKAGESSVFKCRLHSEGLQHDSWNKYLTVYFW